MTGRRVAPWVFPALVAALALAPVRAAAQASTPTSTWTQTLTPDGQPDLQGVWMDTSVTPLERPKALEGRATLTEEEVARLKERADRLFSNDANDFLAGDNLFLALVTGLDTVHNPNATGGAQDMVTREFDNRTALITDPPDGRIPAVTP